MNLKQIIFTFCFFASSAFAQVQTLPAENIEATPIVGFAEETGYWPAQAIDSEKLYFNSLSSFETLNRIPGVDTRGSLSKGSPAITIRGSTKANRTLLLYDGIPLNLADGVGAQELLIPREAIGSVNLLKGPAGIYYGASAMSGAINFIPEFYSRSRIRGAIGSFGQKGVFGAASLLSTDFSQLQLTAYNDSTDGNFEFFSPVSGTRGTRSRNNTHTQRITASGNHNLSGYKLGYRYLRAQEFGSSPGSVTSLDATTGQKTGEIWGARLEKEFNVRTKARTYASHVKTESHFLTYSTQEGYNSLAEQTRAGFSLSFLNPDFISTTLFYDYSRNSIKTSGTLDKRKSEDLHEPGVLLQLPFSEDILLQAGARYLTKYGVVPKAVGAIQSRDSKKFWVTYSEGFRNPSLSDKYDDFPSFSPPFKGNPDLKPESSHQIEVGASRTGLHTSTDFFNHLDYEVAIFSTSYDNLIISQSNTLKNEQYATAWGGELTFSYPMTLWNVGIGYSYLEAGANGTPLAHTTEQKVNILLAHYFGPVIFELNESAWINYRRSSAPTDKHSWLTTDFALRTMALTDWNISAGFINIFNSPIEYFKGYPEPRQRFFISIERLF